MFQSSSLVPDLQLLSFRVLRPLPDCRRRDPCSNCVFAGTTKIFLRQYTLSWKLDHHRSSHAPSRAAKRFCTKSHALPAPPHASKIRHAPARAKFLLLTSALGDVITSTSSANVTRQQLTSSLTMVLTLTVDFSPVLNFSVQVLLT